MTTIRLLRLLVVSAAVWGALPSAAQAAPITFGSNLIENPGAESGTSLGGGSVALDSWAVLSGPAGAAGFTGFSWTFGAGYPVYSDPGPEPPATRGANFFYGGTNSASSSGGQTITGSTSEVQAAIDAGLVTYDLSGWLGGFASQDDNARLTLNFLDAISANLGSVVLGPVLADDRGDVTALLFREATGPVPTGTRSLELILLMTRTAGSSNDGYADNLSLVLNGPGVVPVPEPATLALLGLGAAGMGARRWRRRRTV
jgi:hypothetical protein